MGVATAAPTAQGGNPLPPLRNGKGGTEMIEWLILPALLLIVVLSIVTAKPKPGAKERKDDEGEP